MIGPPEKIHVDMKDTTIPAIVSKRVAQGSVTWIPWEHGSLYYRHSLPAHAGLFRDVIDGLMPMRQLTTNAHPLVEVSLMNQKERTSVHLIKMSGHSQTGYFSPIAMDDITVSLAGHFKRARAVRQSEDLQ
jgi:hypothetical protein